MGLPLTWPILSLANIWCAVNGRIRTGAHEPFRICGDDLLGFWTAEQILRYEGALESIGLVLNQQKTIVSPLRGVFTEQWVTLKPRTVKTAPIQPLKPGERWADAVDEPDIVTPARLVTVRRVKLSVLLLAKALDVSGRPIDEDLPIEITLGASQRQLHELCALEWVRRRADALLHQIHHKPIRNIQQLQMPLYWPEEFGGAGLIGRYEIPELPYRKFASLALSGKTGNLHVGRIKWLRNRVPLSTADSDAVAKMHQLVQDCPAVSHYGRGIAIEDATARATSLALITQRISLQPQRHIVGALRFGKCARLIRRHVLAIAKTLPRKRRPVNPRYVWEKVHRLSGVEINPTKLDAIFAAMRVPAVPFYVKPSTRDHATYLKSSAFDPGKGPSERWNSVRAETNAKSVTFIEPAQGEVKNPTENQSERRRRTIRFAEVADVPSSPKTEPKGLYGEELKSSAL